MRASRREECAGRTWRDYSGAPGEKEGPDGRSENAGKPTTSTPEPHRWSGLISHPSSCREVANPALTPTRSVGFSVQSPTQHRLHIARIKKAPPAGGAKGLIQTAPIEYQIGCTAWGEILQSGKTKCESPVRVRRIVGRCAGGQSFTKAWLTRPRSARRARLTGP